MKASELIIELQKLIDNHGDLDVYSAYVASVGWENDEGQKEVYRIELGEEFNYKTQLEETVFVINKNT